MVSNEVSELMFTHSAVATEKWKHKTRNYHQKPHEFPNNLEFMTVYTTQNLCIQNLELMYLELLTVNNLELMYLGLFTRVFIEFLVILEFVDSNSLLVDSIPIRTFESQLVLLSFKLVTRKSCFTIPRYFPVKFAKFLKTRILNNISQRLLLCSVVSWRCSL